MSITRLLCWLTFVTCAAMARGQGIPVAQPVAPAQQPGTDAAAAAVLSSQAAYNYRLLPHDTVHIRVFHEDDLETTARIDRDGNIPFPLLGTAKIGGETIREATDTMTRLLRTYLVRPQVSLDVVEYSKQRFTILGEVNKPGTFDMPDESSIDLIEAIGMAGGYTKLANPSHITVKRIIDGKESVFKADAKRIIKDPTDPTFQVLPGDIINVGQAMSLSHEQQRKFNSRCAFGRSRRRARSGAIVVRREGEGVADRALRADRGLCRAGLYQAHSAHLLCPGGDRGGCGSGQGAQLCAGGGDQGPVERRHVSHDPGCVQKPGLRAGGDREVQSLEKPGVYPAQLERAAALHGRGDWGVDRHVAGGHPAGDAVHRGGG